MKRTSVTTMAVLLLLLCSFLPASLGCNREVAGEVAMLSGVYLGDVVSALATSYLRDTLGLEESDSSGAHSDDDEHSHDATSLHDHEH